MQKKNYWTRNDVIFNGNSYVSYMLWPATAYNNVELGVSISIGMIDFYFRLFWNVVEKVKKMKILR